MPGPDRRTVLVGGLAFLAGCTAPRVPVPPSPSTVPTSASPVATATSPIPSPRPTTPHDDMVVMTYNILTGARSAHSFRKPVPAADVRFANRLPLLVNWIVGATPDIIGLQENEVMGPPLHRPLRALGPRLPELTSVHADTDVPILYRTSRFRVKDKGVTTISTAHFLRVCTWVILTSKRTGLDVLVVNTHLDSGGSARMAHIREASVIAMAAVIQRVDPHSNLPLLVLGDFNAPTHRLLSEGVPPVFEPLARLGLVNSRWLATSDNSAVPDAATMNSLGTEVDGHWSFGAIRHDGYTFDYVWCGPGIAVRDWQVITGPGVRELHGEPYFAPGPLPSDHCPVRVEVSIPA